MQAHLIIKPPAQGCANDHSGGPTGVENVEVVRAVVRIERGDERVGNGFERAIGKGEDEHAAEKEVVSGGPGSLAAISWDRSKRDEGGNDVQRKRGYHQLAVANL